MAEEAAYAEARRQMEGGLKEARVGQRGGGPEGAESGEARPGRAQGTQKVLGVVLRTVGRQGSDQSGLNLEKFLSCPVEVGGNASKDREGLQGRSGAGARHRHWGEGVHWEGFVNEVPRLWGDNGNGAECGADVQRLSPFLQRVMDSSAEEAAFELGLGIWTHGVQGKGISGGSGNSMDKGLTAGLGRVPQSRGASVGAVMEEVPQWPAEEPALSSRRILVLGQTSCQSGRRWHPTCCSVAPGGEPQ